MDVSNILEVFIMLVSVAGMTRYSLAKRRGCGRKEMWNICGKVCERSCENQILRGCDVRFCSKQPRCICRRWFVRDDRGRCVRSRHCISGKELSRTTPNLQTTSTVTVPAGIPKPKECPRKEQWNICGKVCEKRCDTLDEPPCSFRSCRPNPACICKAGWVRNARGRCVKRKKCGNDHNIAQTTVSPTSASPLPVDADIETSSHHQTSEPPTTSSSTTKKPPGGLPQPKDCQRNEEWNICGKVCEKRCDTLDEPPCSFRSCRPNPACICKAGWVRNSTGRCVRPKKCFSGKELPHDRTTLESTVTSTVSAASTLPSGLPKPKECQRKEEWNICGKVCEKRCDTLDEPPCSFRSCRPNPACICKAGWVRNFMGRCVRPRKCASGKELPQDSSTLGPTVTSTVSAATTLQSGLPKPKECHRKEEWNICGKVCEKRCYTLNEPPCSFRSCRPNPACICKAGWVRNARGRCVKPKKCASIEKATVTASAAVRSTTTTHHQIMPTSSPEIADKECGVNEIFHQCGTLCPEICGVPQPRRACLPVCVKGCFCSRGFIRTPAGDCIPREQCYPP